MDYRSSKTFIDRNWLKKFMQIGLDVTCMYTVLLGVASPVSEILLPLKNSQISLLDHGLYNYSPWSSKNLIDRNRLKKFMQVGLDVTCMYTDFGGLSLYSFRDNITSQKRPNFPFGPWTIVHGHQKISMIGIGSKILCK